MQSRQAAASTSLSIIAPFTTCRSYELDRLSASVDSRSPSCKQRGMGPSVYLLSEPHQRKYRKVERQYRCPSHLRKYSSTRYVLKSDCFQVGLFSAIVTSFFVDSVQNLSPDQDARTNEILSNLTDIIIQLSAGTAPAALNLASPTPFVPDASDVRVNFYWSLSLVLSVSLFTCLYRPI